MEALAASLGLSIAMLVLAGVAVSLMFPLFWVWMLVDALLRDTSAYSSHDIAEKIMWVAVMALVQPAAIVYFFAVWRPGRASAATAAAPTTVATA